LVVSDLAAPAQRWHKHASLCGLQAATSSKARGGTRHAPFGVDCKLRSNAHGCVEVLWVRVQPILLNGLLLPYLSWVMPGKTRDAKEDQAHLHCL
jgi:hypothetical protein